MAIKRKPVNVTMIRSREELDTFLRSVMQNYDSALAVYKDKEKARKSVLNSYDDLQEWLYKGDEQ